MRSSRSSGSVIRARADGRNTPDHLPPEDAVIDKHYQGTAGHYQRRRRRIQRSCPADTLSTAFDVNLSAEVEGTPQVQQLRARHNHVTLDKHLSCSVSMGCRTCARRAGYVCGLRLSSKISSNRRRRRRTGRPSGLRPTGPGRRPRCSPPTGSGAHRGRRGGGTPVQSLIGSAPFKTAAVHLT
jgi:hypothetical protein